MARRRGGVLFVGIKGHVVALDRATGGELWRTKLEGVRMKIHDFVYVLQVYKPGDVVLTRFLRDGEPHEVRVTLATREAE